MRFPEYKITQKDFELMLKCIESYLTSDHSSVSKKLISFFCMFFFCLTDFLL